MQRTNNKAEMKSFTKPDEVRTFPKGKLELVNIGGVIVGRATFEPEWKWSTSLQPIVKTKSCEAPIFSIILPKTIMEFVEKMKPEACYFTPEGGKRTAFFFDLADPTMLPMAAEPFFMNLNADIEVPPAMNLNDMKAGVEKAMKPT